MPIYEYECKDCGQQFEALVRGEEQPACPACGKQNLRRQMSAPAAHTGTSRNSNCPTCRSCETSTCSDGSCNLNRWM